MVKKFVKPLLLSSLGLLGLTAVLWGAVQAIARQRQTQTEAIATEFLNQFPKTDLNDSAKELDRLNAALGLAPSVENSDAPEPSDAAQQAFRSIEEDLKAYLDEQIQKTSGSLDPVPANLSQYLQDHRDELAAIQQHLITAETLTWELDPEAMADFSYAYPRFFPLATLNNLFLLQAIRDSQQGNTADMMLAIEASTQINPALFQRPDLLSNLVGLIVTHQQAGVLRHPDAIPATIPERLLALKQQQSMVESLNFEAWMSYGGLKKMVEDSSSWDLMAENFDDHIRVIPFPKLYLTFSNLDTAQAMEQTYRHLPGRSICDGGVTELETQLMVQPARWNHLGQIAMPSFLAQWHKGGLRMLELELTQKVLQAKALAAQNGGQWPTELPELTSAVCPDEQWVYEVTPEGTMSLAFSHSFDDLDENRSFRHLPLMYQAKTAPAGADQPGPAQISQTAEAKDAAS